MMQRTTMGQGFATISFMLLLCLGVKIQAEDPYNYEMSDAEQELVNKYPETQFAYVPENVRVLVVDLLKDTSSDASARTLCNNLTSGIRMARHQTMLDLMPLVIAELNKKEAHMPAIDYQNCMALSLEYLKALENGDALIISDAMTTKSRKGKFYCKLCVKCLTAGNLIVSGNLAVLGTASIGSCTLTCTSSGLGVSTPAGTATLGAPGGVTLGAAEFIYTTQSPNNSVPPGTAFTISTQVFNNIPAAVIASAGAGGTVFTLTPGTYVFDYEMSLGSAGSVALYTGATAGSLAVDPNTVAGSTTATTWIHGRAIEVVSTSLVVAVSSVVGTAAVVTAGTDAGSYMIRLTILKVA